MVAWMALLRRAFSLEGSCSLYDQRLLVAVKQVCFQMQPASFLHVNQEQTGEDMFQTSQQ